MADTASRVDFNELIGVIIDKIRARDCAMDEWDKLVDLSDEHRVIPSDGKRILDAIIAQMNSIVWFMGDKNAIITDGMRATVHGIQVSMTRNLTFYNCVKWGC